MSGVVVVTGGRDFTDGWAIALALGLVALRVEITALRHGAAAGADTRAAAWATRHRIDVAPWPANWALGPQAGPLRNIEMLAGEPRPVLVVAFPGGNGTAHCVGQARKMGLPVWFPCDNQAIVPECMVDVVEAHVEKSGMLCCEMAPPDASPAWRPIPEECRQADYRALEALQEG